MVQTRVSIEPELLRRVKQLAKAQERKQPAVIADALELYTQLQQHPTPQGIGRYHSVRADISEQAEAILHDVGSEERHVADC